MFSELYYIYPQPHTNINESGLLHISVANLWCELNMSHYQGKPAVIYLVCKVTEILNTCSICLCIIINVYLMLFLDCQLGLDLDEYLHCKEAAMKAMGLALQPHVIVIKDSHDKLGTNDGTVCLAIVQSNMFYEMPTVMAAVDTCPKVCFVKHLNYCPGAKSSWLFAQKAVNDINLASDDTGSKVLQLLSDGSKL